MQIISASEIGEFYYCNLAWWLRKKGVKPQNVEDIKEKLKVEKKPEQKAKLMTQFKISKNLLKGVKRHKEIGEKITIIQEQEVQINYLKYIGYGILIFIIISIIFYLIK